MIVKRTIESHLNLLPVPGPKGHKFHAKQMIVRSVHGNAGGAGEEGKVNEFDPSFTRERKWSRFCFPAH